MPVRTGQAQWSGTLKEGHGSIRLENAGFEGPYTWHARFEEAEGTNPEELIAGAHAACFSMALSGDLEKAGFTADSISTTAGVHLGRVDGKSTITQIDLSTEVRAPGIEPDELQRIAEGTKQNCPVSRALAAVSVINVTVTQLP